MSNTVQSININKAASGLCPHGTIPGACPICSGMGGGGGLRVGERPQKAGEMSYHECAMIGAMMRAREMAQKQHEANILQHNLLSKIFAQNMQSVAQKLSEFVTKIQNNFLLRPVAYTINNIVVPILNKIADLPNIVSVLKEQIIKIKDKLFDIQDKLNAIFGEAKLFVNKKISELVSNIKSKLIILFKVFQRTKTKNNETKIDEAKKIFRIKILIDKILKKHRDNDSED